MGVGVIGCRRARGRVCGLAGRRDRGVLGLGGASVPAVCCLAGGGCARCNRAVKGAERRSAPLTARGRLAWSACDTRGQGTNPAGAV